VRPAKTPTPTIEINQSSSVDRKKRLTRLAMMMPTRPMNRKVPNPDRSRRLVYPKMLSAPNVVAVMKNTRVIDELV
jgi:hypothetical protein